MKLMFLFFLLLPSASWATKVEVKTENLRSILAEKNARLKASELQKQAAERREGHFLRSFLPKVQGVANLEKFQRGTGSWNSQPSFGLEAKLNLFRGGRDYLEEKVRELESQRRAALQEETTIEELEKALQHLWRYRFSQEKEKLLKASIERNEKNLQAALQRIRSGVATASDRYEFEINASELNRELILIDEEIDHEKKELALLLGVPLEDLVVNQPFQHDHEFTQLKAQTANADILVRDLELAAQQAQSRARQEAKRWWPSVDAYGLLLQKNQREENLASAKDRREAALGLQLSMEIPWDSGWESAALAREAEATEILAEQEKRELHLSLEIEWVEIQLMHDQVHEAEENIVRAQKYFQSTLQEYARGVKNSPDVLGASDKLFAMEIKRLEIIRNFQIAQSHYWAKVNAGLPR
jgi:outer membrane protein